MPDPTTATRTGRCSSMESGRAMGHGGVAGGRNCGAEEGMTRRWGAASKASGGRGMAGAVTAHGGVATR